MPYRVGIVGCGVAGATTAYLLARDGHAVTVLEQAPELTAVGAGIILQASGQAVLEHLGVKQQVLARAAPLDELYARHDDGTFLITNRYADYDASCGAYGIHRGIIFGELLKLVRTTPTEIRLGCRVMNRTIHGNEVWLTDTAGNQHGPFDFVVAGDGSRSSFRNICRLPARIREYSHGTLWLIAPATNVQRKLLQVVRSTKNLFGLMPMGDGLSTLYWGVPLAEFPNIRKRGLEALKNEILRFAPEAAEVLDFLYDFDQLLLTNYRHVWMRRKFDQHTLFLGDAAHAMSPHLGQGLNLAMVDAWRFAACVRETRTPIEAFRLFVSRQRAYLRYYQMVTWFLSPFFQSDYRILGFGRDVVLPWLTRIPIIRKQMLMTVTGLKGGFLKGRREV